MQCHDAVGVPSLVIRQPGQIMAPNISLLLLNHPLTCTVKLESPYCHWHIVSIDCRYLNTKRQIAIPVLLTALIQIGEGVDC